jgi:hypothetical protein
MLRFRGVTTKYLPSYLGWRRLIDRASTAFSAWRALAAAHAR